jgi:hypothetical protein
VTSLFKCPEEGGKNLHRIVAPYLPKAQDITFIVSAARQSNFQLTSSTDRTTPMNLYDAESAEKTEVKKSGLFQFSQYTDWAIQVGQSFMCYRASVG